MACPGEYDYHFVERPSQDFLCPVSLELLLEPQQTSCCGHHLSLEAATRLRTEGKPCPMCNEASWSAVLDKYHRRKVHEVRVYCWHKGNGCEWVGELNSVAKHATSCEHGLWKCEYCGLRCEFVEGGEKHWPTCPKFPEPCPNSCEVGSVERCNMEQHRSECSLEPVACEMKEFGCSVVVPRKELARHMRESELQHLTAMTMLNLRLTKQLQQESTERDKKIETLQEEMLALKKHSVDCTTAIRKQEQVVATDHRISQLETKLIEKISELEHVMKQIDRQSEEISEQVSVSGAAAADPEYGCSGTEFFTFKEYIMNKGSDEGVFSDPFFTDHEGYMLNLTISYYESDIGAELQLMRGRYDRRLHWPVLIEVRLEVLSQVCQYPHVVRVVECEWDWRERGEDKSVDDNLMRYSTLERKMYMMDNSINFKITVTVL